MTGNFYVHNNRVFQIVNRYGVNHFKGGLVKCDCPYSGCSKNRFPHPAIAMLYSKYIFMKYGEQQDKYWSDECECYHLTTADYEVWEYT